ncbi:MAG: glycosyltransferase [Candidatus Latescibacteria bacterium]|nr:glycosyltransferase [Candidatus Latescibacterota bacterium]
METSAGIAVIVTSHNYGRYLGECLASIMAQTLKPSTIVVVDDASVDDTESVARGFREVSYHSVDFRNGNRARNFGFSLVSADMVVFFDADNTMSPGFLQRLHGALAADPGADFAYCDRINVAEGDVSWHPEPLGRWRSRPFDPRLLRRVNYIDLASLIRSRCFPGFDEDLRRYQDWDLWLNLVTVRGARGIHVPEPLFHYRIHEESLSRREDLARAVWAVRRKYRLGTFFKLPVIRDAFWLYSALRWVRGMLTGRGAAQETPNQGDTP